MMIHQDGANVSGYAWDDETPTEDFDNVGRYSEQFNALRNEWGEVVRITEDTGTTVTITTDDGTLLLTYDTQSGNLVPVVGELTDGTPNMFKRTLNVNGTDVTFVCDADGKVCYFNNGYFLVVENGDEFSPSSDGSTLNALYTAAGGSVEVTVTKSSDNNMTKVANGNYFFVINQDGYVTFGKVEKYLTPNPFANGYGMIIVNPDEMDIVFLADNNYNYCKVDDKPIVATGSGWAYGSTADIENYAGNIVKGSIDVAPAALEAQSLTFTLNGDSVTVGSWEELDSIELMNT